MKDAASGGQRAASFDYVAEKHRHSAHAKRAPLRLNSYKEASLRYESRCGLFTRRDRPTGGLRTSAIYDLITRHAMRPPTHSLALNTPEASLRLCLRSRWDPAVAAGLAAQARQPGWNWEAVASRAFAEGLAPLLFAQLSQTEMWPAVPPGVRDALAAAYEGSAIRNAVLRSELKEIVARLAHAGIAVLLLKGAALAEAIYGDGALRLMSDLDLLVHRADVGAALEILAANGYTAPREEVRPGATLAYESELLLSKPGVIGIQVELHWRLLDSPFYQQTLPLEWFWETAAPVWVGGVAAAALGLEALVLYLCAHLALHHRGEGLKWWLDLAELIRRAGDRLDWPGLLRRAEACALVIPLQETLPALVAVWGVRVPPEVLARTAAMQSSAAERRVHASLTAARRPVAQRFWADLSGLPTWPARIRFAWSQIVPSPAYMVSRYRPRRRWLLPLLYPWRWLTGMAGALAHGATRLQQRAPR